MTKQKINNKKNSKNNRITITTLKKKYQAITKNNKITMKTLNKSKRNTVIS